MSSRQFSMNTDLFFPHPASGRCQHSPVATRPSFNQGTIPFLFILSGSGSIGLRSHFRSSIKHKKKSDGSDVHDLVLHPSPLRTAVISITTCVVVSRCWVLGWALYIHEPVLFTHLPGTHATVRIPCFQLRKLSSEISSWPSIIM